MLYKVRPFSFFFKQDKDFIVRILLKYRFLLLLDDLQNIMCHLYPAYLYHDEYIGLAVRVFASGPGDLGSIPGRVIPKTQKMVLDASLHNTQYYKVRIKGKVEQSREGVASSPTPWCSSYRKGSLQVTLDYGRQLYFIYIFLCGCTRINWKVHRLTKILS